MIQFFFLNKNVTKRIFLFNFNFLFVFHCLINANSVRDKKNMRNFNWIEKCQFYEINFLLLLFSKNAVSMWSCGEYAKKIMKHTKIKKNINWKNYLHVWMYSKFVHSIFENYHFFMSTEFDLLRGKHAKMRCFQPSIEFSKK